MSELIGKTIGQYQIVELIEDIGASWIYKGFQPNMNRYVAVKVLKSQDPAAVGAFNSAKLQFSPKSSIPISCPSSILGVQKAWLTGCCDISKAVCCGIICLNIMTLAKLPD